MDFFIEEDIDCQQYLMTNSIFNQHVFNSLLSKNIDFQISYDGAYGNLRFRKNSKTVVNDEVINLEIQGESYFRNGLQHKMEIPFVWLPDGFVAMTITYATSKAKGAEKIIIGNFSEGKIRLNQPLIETMKNNFAKNVSIYCTDCPIQKLCRGTIHFTPFATDTFVPERDGYFCEVARNMVKAFPESSPP